MRVLVACEFSATVGSAFHDAGHDVLTCDLLPTERPDIPHHQGDVTPLLREPWDLVVAHPECTYLTNSGVRWLYDDRPEYRLRWQQLIDGAAFFRACLEANARMVAVENPVMHGWARKIVGRGPDQIVQPWQYGHGETKATGLWLKGLPPLMPTDVVDGREARVHRMPPGPNRWKERSRFFPGIAAAMAEQWGKRLEAVAS